MKLSRSIFSKSPLLKYTSPVLKTSRNLFFSLWRSFWAYPTKGAYSVILDTSRPVCPANTRHVTIFKYMNSVIHNSSWSVLVPPLVLGFVTSRVYVTWPLTFRHLHTQAFGVSERLVSLCVVFNEAVWEEFLRKTRAHFKSVVEMYRPVTSRDSSNAALLCAGSWRVQRLRSVRRSSQNPRFPPWRRRTPSLQYGQIAGEISSTHLHVVHCRWPSEHRVLYHRVSERQIERSGVHASA